MHDQQTAAPPDETRTYPEFDRRRGPRRSGGAGDVQVGTERRQTDRRRRKPGFAGLWGAIFGTARSEQEETPSK
jgi:hypothetical protein